MAEGQSADRTTTRSSCYAGLVTLRRPWDYSRIASIMRTSSRAALLRSRVAVTTSHRSVNAGEVCAARCGEFRVITVRGRPKLSQLRESIQASKSLKSRLDQSPSSSAPQRPRLPSPGPRVPWFAEMTWIKNATSPNAAASIGCNER